MKSKNSTELNQKNNFKKNQKDKRNICLTIGLRKAKSSIEKNKKESSDLKEIKSNCTMPIQKCSLSFIQTKSGVSQAKEEPKQSFEIKTSVESKIIKKEEFFSKTQELKTFLNSNSGKLLSDSNSNTFDAEIIMDEKINSEISQKTKKEFEKSMASKKNQSNPLEKLRKNSKEKKDLEYLLVTGKNKTINNKNSSEFELTAFEPHQKIMESVLKNFDTTTFENNEMIKLQEFNEKQESTYSQEIKKE